MESSFKRMMKTLDPVGEIREVLIAATDMVPVGEEPYVGWSAVLAERIAAALGLDDLDAATKRMKQALEAAWLFEDESEQEALTAARYVLSAFFATEGTDNGND